MVFPVILVEPWEARSGFLRFRKKRRSPEGPQLWTFTFTEADLRGEPNLEARVLERSSGHLWWRLNKGPGVWIYLLGPDRKVVMKEIDPRKDPKRRKVDGGDAKIELF